MAKNGKITKKFFLDSESEEFQKMLVGVRVFLSLMTEKGVLNFLTFSFLLATPLIYLFIMLWYYNPEESTISFLAVPISFLVISTIIVTCFSIYRDYKFSIKNGLIILFRYPATFFTFVFTLPFITLVISTSFIGKESFYILLIYSVGYTSLALVLIVFLMMFFGLKTNSIVKYAKQIVKDTINDDERKNIFELYYYGIFIYHRKIINMLRAKYRKDILLYFKVDRIPLLASQVITDDETKKFKLIGILSRLEKTEPLNNPDEYINIMDDIEKNYMVSICHTNNPIDLRNIFREKTILEKIKIALIPIIPAVVTVSGLILDHFNILN